MVAAAEVSGAVVGNGLIHHSVPWPMLTGGAQSAATTLRGPSLVAPPEVRDRLAPLGNGCHLLHPGGASLGSLGLVDPGKGGPADRGRARVEPLA
jgi:hypothetical protein